MSCIVLTIVQGISMPIDQYSTLVGLLPQIEKQLKAKGEAVARPDYDGKTTAEDDEHADVDDDASEQESSNSEHPSDDDD